MAYKDEYEVARLLLQETFTHRVKAMFTGPVRMKFNLQPPLMRWFGLNKKVALGSWIRPVLALLAKGAFLRGTILDPFGYMDVRREERAILLWYRALVEELIPSVGLGLRPAARKMLSLPQDIRGYEDIKSAAYKEAKAKSETLRVELKSEMEGRREFPVKVSRFDEIAA